MKKPIKLNQHDLRHLINEAIQGREPGSPLFTPPHEPRKMIKESVDLIVDQVGQALGDYFRSQYDPNDPIQREYGPEAWNVQLDIAVDDVVSALIEKIEEVQTKLHNGDYVGL